MSKKKKYIWAIVSKDDFRDKPARIWGAFNYDDLGLEQAKKYLEKKNNKKLEIRKV